MKCSECGAFIPVSDRSTRMFPGVEVLRCRVCGTFRINGDDMVVRGGAGAMDNLRDVANRVLAQRRHTDMIESDIEDPRWENLTR